MCVFCDISTNSCDGAFGLRGGRFRVFRGSSWRPGLRGGLFRGYLLVIWRPRSADGLYPGYLPGKWRTILSSRHKMHFLHRNEPRPSTPAPFRVANQANLTTSQPGAPFRAVKFGVFDRAPWYRPLPNTLLTRASIQLC